MDFPGGEVVVTRTAEEIAGIRKACRVVREVLDELVLAARPGVTTLELDRIAAAGARSRGAAPAFLGYQGYPASLCVSVNDEVVHGIPSPHKTLADGDLVGLDFGVELDGWYGDSARTVAVGRAPPGATRLLRVGEEALRRAIAAARPGGTIGDIGHAVQSFVEGEGFGVVRDFVGHGIGRRLHEPPQVPNVGHPGSGRKLFAGMVIAIEPMVNAGEPSVETLDDGWTAVTSDGSLSVHFEHTVAIDKNGPEILTL